MTAKQSAATFICLCALPSICFGELPNRVLPNAPILIAAMNSGQGTAITDIPSQLVGTNWKAEPLSTVRPGLYATLKFNQQTVKPADYLYEFNKHDFTVRIFFDVDQ